MPISWNEIRSRSYAFVNEWQDESRERAESQSFWNDFLNVFNVNRRRVGTFEHAITKLSGNTGFIDLFWSGTLMVEQKSRGENLDAAYTQASDYFATLEDAELPHYVLVSDFERFRLYDMDNHGKEVATFTLKELPQNLNHFGFIAGYETTEVRPEDPVNVEAAEKMGRLHDKLLEAGYQDHALQVYLVRLLFCLFAEDTGIFNRNLFRDLVLNFTSVDGSDLGPILSQLFQTLNTAQDRRMKNLPDHFAEFAYVNGALFEETLPTASFDSKMRELLLDATSLNWSKISPAIFGSLFQSVMNPEERRNLGAHYTSEANILKVIEPLFLDDLKQEFERAKRGSRPELERFHDKLATLNFLDPACGCGNFLVVAYRELRLLELEVLQALYQGQMALDIANLLRLNVDQFYGIEIEEFPAQIAQVAMWLTDHQMNLKVSEAFGQYFVRLPLEKSATIVYENALRVDWETVVPKHKLDYILGNPPFIGKHLQTDAQKDALVEVFGGQKGIKNLDFVAAWYKLAVEYMRGTQISCAFVSTNSITQGEQPGYLWMDLFENYGLKIHFGHRTFKWSNQARGNAAVHCVIIGFGLYDVPDKQIFQYETITSEPTVVTAKNISPYLVEGPDFALPSRSKPISDVPPCQYGSKPVDGRYLLFSNDEKIGFISKYPAAEKYIRPMLSAEEYLHGELRWCLWLVDAEPGEIRSIEGIRERLLKVREYRLASPKAQTQTKANEPSLFAEIRQPQVDFIVVPRHTTETRDFIPFGFFDPEFILHDSCSAVVGADLYHFGVMSSTMHMVWARSVAGRIKSDIRYSTKLVYNNFPFPFNVGKDRQQSVAGAATEVIDARAAYPDSVLADLYDPVSMPSRLVKAHRQLDRVVDLCYRPQPFTTELNRMTYLFELYRQVTAPLVSAVKKKRK